MAAMVALPVFLRIGAGGQEAQIGVIELDVTGGVPNTGPLIAEFLRAAADAYEHTTNEGSSADAASR